MNVFKSLNLEPDEINLAEIESLLESGVGSFGIDNDQLIDHTSLRFQFIEELKKEIHQLEFYDCKDFYEMAQIIKSCKFFLGNLCFAYSVAEGLKVPRLLEASPDFPVVFPVGLNAFDFYHQNHFEKMFDTLSKL